ncbi:MAG: hypothetical protein ABR505_06200 [Actinomycetota bacterium]
MGLTPEVWEARLKDSVTGWIRTGQDGHRNARDPQIEITDVRLSGNYPDTGLAVLFRAKSRPGCLFGYRWDRFWEYVRAEREAMPVHTEADLMHEPEEFAFLFFANFQETLEADEGITLPDDCEGDSIRWIN